MTRRERWGKRSKGTCPALEGYNHNGITTDKAMTACADTAQYGQGNQPPGELYHTLFFMLCIMCNRMRVDDLLILLI